MTTIQSEPKCFDDRLIKISGKSCERVYPTGCSEYYNKMKTFITRQFGPGRENSLVPGQSMSQTVLSMRKTVWCLSKKTKHGVVYGRIVLVESLENENSKVIVSIYISEGPMGLSIKNILSESILAKLLVSNLPAHDSRPQHELIQKFLGARGLNF
jgi:hypothetical protein